MTDDLMTREEIIKLVGDIRTTTSPPYEMYFDGSGASLIRLRENEQPQSEPAWIFDGEGKLRLGLICGITDD